ncbi:helix-turn-helix transcriptional regulator [Aliiruegeria lutimaris]|uniref:helix-turn-helix transcriptional regulator n=1 Tax=Aliiruegeria lutimaris TaxID=571298 RepID=UPI000A5EB511|nr:helix-turn-helix transcriptional regulator [Aliiruegeria lutimaris]
MKQQPDDLQVELAELRAALEAIGIGDNRKHLTRSPVSAIHPVTLDRKLVQRIATALAAASEALSAPDQSPETPEDLSQRQKEILSWVALGKSNSVIASILGISPHTVDTHLRRIFDRLDTTDRTVAAIRGIQAGLIAA